MAFRSEAQRLRVANLAGVPREFCDASLEDFKNLDIGAGESLYIYGAPGVGKTHLACAILMEAKAERVSKPCLFVPVNELLFEIRNTFHQPHSSGLTEQAVVDRYTAADLLVLDDLGNTKPTDWSIQTLDLIVDRRYRTQQQTIVTTNLSITALGAMLGERLARRIGQMCTPMMLSAEED